jgi:hypothetical protein
MRRTARLSVAAAAVGVVGLVASPAALAQSAEYTGTGDKQVRSSVGTAPAPTQSRGGAPALPFTGGEIVLIATAGAAAVAAGGIMIVGGRRRAGNSS